MQIILCPTCGGNGYHECSEVTDYHKRESRYWKVKCKTCNGKGRMIESRSVKQMPDVEVQD
jgi:DnaJ-class molecular chaperone